RGGFILDTPTTASDDTDYMCGIWFLTPTSPEGPSLDIPMLPTGWSYESWVTDTYSDDPIPMSMGAFWDPGLADVNGGGCGAGPDSPEPFPGQDFINICGSQPVKPNLAHGNWSVVISIE